MRYSFLRVRVKKTHTQNVNSFEPDSNQRPKDAWLGGYSLQSSALPTELSKESQRHFPPQSMPSLHEVGEPLALIVLFTSAVD